VGQLDLFGLEFEPEPKKVGAKNRRTVAAWRMLGQHLLMLPHWVFAVLVLVLVTSACSESTAPGTTAPPASAPVQTPPMPGTSKPYGRLPPEVIQRIVRANFDRLRLCYENGLRNNPNLQGRVAVRFVIGRDGAVSNVGNGGSDMPDGNVVSCVVRAFYGLSFPPPDGGTVTVTYPIMFSPEEPSDAGADAASAAPR
jgi:hypothetical protein